MTDSNSTLDDEGSMEEFAAYLVTDMGYSRNECPEHCPYKAEEHAHLHSPGNPASIGIPPRDFILWEDGTASHSDPTRGVEAPPAEGNTGVSADDLTTFKAQLDEEYAAADMLAVQGTNWRADEDLPGVVLSEYGHVAARCSEDELSGAEMRAKHIARYDVRRARLDIKARRAILEEYERDPQADDRYLAGLAFAIERLAEVHTAPWWKN